MSAPTPTSDAALLVTLVAGATETREGRWEKLIGDIQVLPIAFHPRSNWRVELGGVEDERKVLDAAVALLRGEHPYVDGEVSPGWQAGA